MNSVALCIKLTSHKQQQTCIHCNTVPNGKYLTFDKTKYGENAIVHQMTERDQQNIICNKGHNTICKETLVTCVRCTKTITKICTLKFDMKRYTSLEQHIQDMAKSHKTNCYICSSLVVSKHGLYAGSPGSIPTAVTTRTAAGGDAEHVSLNSLTCSTIQRCKIGTSQMLGGQL